MSFLLLYVFICHLLGVIFIIELGEIDMFGQNVGYKPVSLSIYIYIHTYKHDGAQDNCTQIFIIWELISQLHRTSVTKGFLAELFLCNAGVSIRYFL